MSAVSDIQSGGFSLLARLFAKIRFIFRNLLILSIFSFGCLFSACSSDTNRPANDPLEPINRAVFMFNDAVDQAALRPTSYVYKKAIPKGVRTVIGNVLRWSKEPVILANDLMQGDMGHAKISSARFLVNGSLLGLVEIAEGLGLPYRDEDFGQTLGVYGVGDGPYIVLPLLGPSSGRDSVGLVVDHFLNPFSYISSSTQGFPYALMKETTKAVHFRAENFDQIDDLRSGSIDFYAKVRTIYRQKRHSSINNGKVTTDVSSFENSEKFDQYLSKNDSVDKVKSVK